MDFTGIPTPIGVLGGSGDVQVISRTLCVANSGESGGATDSLLSLSTSEPSSEGSRLQAGLPEGLSFAAETSGGRTTSCDHQAGFGGAVYDCAAPAVETNGPTHGCALPFIRDPQVAEHLQLPLGCYQPSPMDSATGAWKGATADGPQHLEKMMGEGGRGTQETADEYRQRLAARLKASCLPVGDPSQHDPGSDDAGEGVVIDKAEWQRQLAACADPSFYDVGEDEAEPGKL